MVVPKFQHNYRTIAFQNEHDFPVSKTVVGKAMSLREIINRDLVNTIVPKPNAVEFFNESIVIPDFRSMDLVEIDDWKANLEAHREVILKDIKNARKEKMERIAAEKARQLALSAQSDPVRAAESGQ